MGKSWGIYGDFFRPGDGKTSLSELVMEHGPVESEFPVFPFKMVDLSSSLWDSLPEDKDLILGRYGQLGRLISCISGEAIGPKQAYDLGMGNE